MVQCCCPHLDRDVLLTIDGNGEQAHICHECGHYVVRDGYYEYNGEQQWVTKCLLCSRPAVVSLLYCVRHQS